MITENKNKQIKKGQESHFLGSTSGFTFIEGLRE